MKIMTLFGTRPEIIRLNQVIKTLDRFCEQVLVHTGQNYDPNLSEIFFRDLNLRKPDIHMGVEEPGFAQQAGRILTRSGEVLSGEKPERLLILGDTNSGLAAIVAARMGIPVYHMEAGNRCYDDRVPEEINRRIIDHSSTVLMPYTHRSKENLLREGIERDRIFVIGNPIYEVLDTFKKKIETSDVMNRMKVDTKSYFLSTMHRAENVDRKERLKSLLSALSAVADHYECPLLVSVHPRTLGKMEEFGLSPDSPRVRLLKPLGFFEFVKLEKYARLVLSDSGTVQEECSIFRVPNVTIRDVTERPETVECGTNVLSGPGQEDILRAVDVALTLGSEWTPPWEYTVPDVSRTVAKIVLGHTSLRRHYSKI
jgi:UDP-N-acetylglucosamine 2-epimerase (non-hydrolysing)